MSADGKNNWLFETQLNINITYDRLHCLLLYSDNPKTQSLYHIIANIYCLFITQTKNLNVSVCQVNQLINICESFIAQQSDVFQIIRNISCETFHDLNL